MRKIFSLLKQKGLRDFKYFKIGITLTEELTDNGLRFVPEYMYDICLPLRDSLKIFLEILGLFEEIFTYTKKLSEETRIITNIMQGDTWLTKYASKFKDEIVFPLYIFYDDLECGDAFGSHAGEKKFGAIYTILANLPPHLAARLQSVIFTSLVHSQDKKVSSNEKVFLILLKN